MIFARFFRQHLNTSLFANAYYLIVNSGGTALLGFAFWAITTRLYSDSVVGQTGAVISAITLLATVSKLGLGLGLIRFLPQAGDRSVRMINSSFTIAAIASAVTILIFLLGLNFWSPALLFITDRPLYITGFTVFTVCWAISLILDEIFVSRLSARYTLLKNIIINVTKIPLLLILFFFISDDMDIVNSTGIALVVGIVISIFWLLPKIEKQYKPFLCLEKETIKEVIPFSIGNHIADMMWGMPALLFPLMVTNILGAETNAYFYIAWMIANMTFQVARSFSFSLFAEGSNREDSLMPNTGKALAANLSILLVVIVIFFLVGDKILLLFGEEYSSNATRLLWILVVSAVPFSINYICLSIMRVRKTVAMLNFVSFVVFFLSLGLGYFLVLKMDLTGIGWGWLAAHTFVMLVISVPFLIKQRRLFQ